jgi:hypothetical protein
VLDHDGARDLAGELCGRGVLVHLEQLAAVPRGHLALEAQRVVNVRIHDVLLAADVFRLDRRDRQAWRQSIIFR